MKAQHCAVHPYLDVIAYYSLNCFVGMMIADGTGRNVTQNPGGVMTAHSDPKYGRRSSGIADDVRKLSAELDAARNINRNFKRAKAIGTQLAPLLTDAYWNSPEVFKSSQVRAARSFVTWLKRARYIEPQPSLFYRGGSPGLGRKS